MDITRPWLFLWEDYHVDTEEQETCVDSKKEEDGFEEHEANLIIGLHGFSCPL